MPKSKKEFDKASYDKEFQRQHYKKITAAFTKSEAAKIEAAAANAGISKSTFIKQAVFEKIEREG